MIEKLLSENWSLHILVDYIAPNDILNIASALHWSLNTFLNGMHLCQDLSKGLLLASAQKGNMASVEYLVNSHYCDKMNESEAIMMNSEILQLAAEFGHSHVAEYILETGYIVTDWASLKLLAARNGRLDCLEMFLRYEKHTDDSQYYPALHMIGMCFTVSSKSR